MPDPNRTYDEEEIASLLERTAKLQADDVREDKLSSQSLSLSELESIASEAGLDLEYLHRAALEIESTGKKGFQKRTKTHIHTQRYLASELSEDLWEEFVFELRKSFGANSNLDLSGSGALGNSVVEKIGRSREWRHTSNLGVHTSALLRPYKKGTRIEMSQMVGLGSPRTESITYGFLLALLPAFILAVIMGKSLLIGAVSLAVFMAAFIPLVYKLDTRWREKKLVHLESVADRLITMATEISAPEAAGIQTIEESQATHFLEVEDEVRSSESLRPQRDKRTRS